MIKKYQSFFEEITIKGNQGVPGEGKDKDDPKYLSNVERRARLRLGDNGRPLPEDFELVHRYGPRIMQLVQTSSRIIAGKEKELEDLAKEVIMSQYGAILDNVELDIHLGSPQSNLSDEDGGEADLPSFRITDDPDL